MGNSANPFRPHSEASNQGLNCVLRSVCPNTLGKYRIYQDNILDLKHSISYFIKVPSLRYADSENVFGHMLIAMTQISITKKKTYSNIVKILSPKNGNFQIKNSDIIHISVQNIDYGYSLELPQWSSSNKYPQSMFLSRKEK